MVQWEPVLTNCTESSYTLIYTATVLWKEDPPATETLPMGSNLSHIIKEEYYIPYTKYAFNVTTETKSGLCTITSNQASKYTLRRPMALISKSVITRNNI